MESKPNPDLLPAANLAYLGDCVYELFVRETLVLQNEPHPSVASLGYVTAPRQSQIVARILPLLTEEEESQFRRGRNIGHSNVPRAASPAEYRRATGLEALIGWLYLKGREDRIRELLTIGTAEDGEPTDGADD